MDDVAEESEAVAAVAAFDAAVDACLVQLDGLIGVGDAGVSMLTAVRRKVVHHDRLGDMAKQHGIDLDELAFRVALSKVATLGRGLTRKAVTDAAKRPGPSKAGAP